MMELKESVLTAKHFRLKNNNRKSNDQADESSLFALFKQLIIIRTAVSHCLDFMSN